MASTLTRFLIPSASINLSENVAMLFLIKHMTFPHHADVQGNTHFMGGSEAEKTPKTNIVIPSIDNRQSAAAE